MIDKNSIISPNIGQFDVKYKGYSAAQNMYVFSALDILSDITNGIDIIIEVGTFRGGLTKILHDHPISCSAEIFTYDINNSKISEEGDNITFIKGDIFEEIDNIKTIIRGKKTIVFCDGGNKIKELQMFAPILNKGDFILCHDFAEDMHTFAQDIKGKFWNACEVTMNDRVISTINDFNLIKHNHEHFTKSVWLCLEKS